MKKRFIDTIFNIGMQCLLQKKDISLKADISQREFVVIDSLEFREKLSCNALSKRIGLSVSRTSRIIDQLLRKRYLVRKINPSNRRAVQVYLSAKGGRLKQNIEKLKNECEKDILNSLDPKKRKIVEDGMKILRQSLS